MEAPQPVRLVIGEPSDGSAAADLMPLVYNELRALAAWYMGRERAGHTLQPTAVVHEAYMRLAEADGLEFRGRSQFLALAASQIRKVLVDHARRRGAAKRGGNATRVSLEHAARDGGVLPNAGLLDLEDALVALEGRSLRQARIVEMRYFAGLSINDIASILEVSPGTVKNDWQAARAWLAQRLDSRGSDRSSADPA